MTKHGFSFRRHRRVLVGFTLVEALVATTITAIAASALLLGIGSALQTTNHSTEQAIAHGLAQQLLDEVAGARYAALGPNRAHDTVFAASAYEQAGLGRELYDDVDDYHGLTIQPPTDPWGVELGTEDIEGDHRHPGFHVPSGFFDNWRQEVDVYYVDESNLTTPLPAGQVSDYRVIEVRIVYVDPERGRRELAKLRRVVAYVPPL